MMRKMSGLKICMLAVGATVVFTGCSTKSSTETTTVAETTTEATTAAETVKETQTEADTTVAETEAETVSAESKVVAAASEGTGEVFDNQFIIDGTTYTLPISVGDLSGLGFAVPEKKAGNVLNANEFTSGSLDTPNGEKIFVGFYNLGSEGIKLGEAKLSSINFAQKSLNDIKVTIAKGITFGSTIDEVKAAYGEPSDFIDGDAAAKVLRERMKYKNPDDSQNFYELSFEDKALVGIEIYVAEQ